MSRYFGIQNSIVFPYGSRIYGTNSESSDHDFLIVVPDDSEFFTGQEVLDDRNNLQFYRAGDFQKQLAAHKIHTLEAISVPGVIHPFKFSLNLAVLRESISEKASHSFVKAKKKIEVEHDFYVGWKSLFHSLRILNFGSQIARCGKVEDFSAANHFWFEILHAQQYRWDYFKSKYQPVFNELATEFRKIAPK